MTPDLEKWIGTARDGALLRYSLGLQYAKSGDYEKATLHFSEAVARNPLYSAAWKGLAGALADAGRRDEALQAYRSGVAAAQKAGDKQAEKEMRVFLRRLEKAAQPSGGTNPVRKA
ncbi:MAG TPA: tetratricopeptide repeat protein [Burkholderiales bacterium]|jgi:Flp pilus assembly protein TadD|nr:tetratricopeptide repeat protein [Burkholderiales bacterium]